MEVYLMRFAVPCFVNVPPDCSAGNHWHGYQCMLMVQLFLKVSLIKIWLRRTHGKLWLEVTLNLITSCNIISMLLMFFLSHDFNDTLILVLNLYTKSSYRSRWIIFLLCYSVFTWYLSSKLHLVVGFSISSFGISYLNCLCLLDIANRGCF